MEPEVLGVVSRLASCSFHSDLSRIQRDGQAANRAATQVLEGLAQTGELRLENSKVRISSVLLIYIL